MWNQLPIEILGYIFSFLPPDSLARANVVSKQWQACIRSRLFTSSFQESHQREPPWFILFSGLTHGSICCYLHNPSVDNWYVLSLDFLPCTYRPICQVNGLVIGKSCRGTNLQLGIFNPFTRQHRHLPMLNVNRTNPAFGVVKVGAGSNPNCSPSYARFCVYVAGGMSSMPSGSGATYVPTIEMYKSDSNTWKVVCTMPFELAVRLTVWTSNESVHIDGILYWITSARAYSIMGFEIESKKWIVLSVPMADELEFATLMGSHGKLTLVGGTCRHGACIWEHEVGEGKSWILVGNVPSELGRKLLGPNAVSWSGTKCVGFDGVIYLYKELKSGMIVCRESVEKGTWEWLWFSGFGSMINGRGVSSSSIRGLLMHPNLSIFR